MYGSHSPREAPEFDPRSPLQLICRLRAPPPDVRSSIRVPCMPRTVFAFLVVAIGSATGSANQSQQSPWPAKVTLDAHIHQIAGPNIADCGIRAGAPVSSETLNTALQCATTMAQRHLAFRVVQSGPSDDSEVAWGIVGTADGSVVSFSYDSAPCGGPACAERFDTTTCRLADVKPTKLLNGVLTLACSQR